MEIIVTEAEFREEGMSAEELKARIVNGLENAGDYPGFNVEIETTW